jgi:transposase
MKKMNEQMQKKKSFIGIDVSKLTLDVCIINNEGFVEHQEFENNKNGFKKIETWLVSTEVFSLTDALFCMEHTGIYTRELVEYLLLQGAQVWLESALHLKRSMGMTRGKNDKVDSQRIARYAMTNSDKAMLVTLSNKTLQLIKDLMTNRNRVKKSIQSIKVSVKEMERVDKATAKELKKLNKPAMTGLLKSKEAIEKRILVLINSDAEIKNIFELVTSVKGVGNVLATELMVFTHGFTRMTNVKQLACYCGVAPFSHTSGTSVRGKTGTSNFANMGLKSTLHLAAISSTQYVPELKIYFERKVAEGKSKMCVINAIRNKLLNRVLAVVKRGTPYVENYLQNNLVKS